MADSSSKDDDILYEPFYKGQTLVLGDYPNGPVEKIRELLARKKDFFPVFAELLVLEADEEPDSETRLSWFEVSRWIKFEETVDEGGKRWSKPHISLLELPSLLQLRNCFRKGLVLLDEDYVDFPTLIEGFIMHWNNMLSPPLDSVEVLSLETLLFGPKHHLEKSALKAKFSSYRELTELVKAQEMSSHSSANQLHRSENESSCPNIVVHEEHLAETEPLQDKQQTNQVLLQLPTVDHSKKHDKLTSNVNLLKKLAHGAEAAVIFVGQVAELSRPLFAFARLLKSKPLKGLTEAPIPVRFVSVLLVPLDHIESQDLTAIGRSLGTLMADEAFSQVAYKCEDGNELCLGIDEFLSNILVIPACKWDRQLRLEPADTTLPKRIPTIDKQDVKKRTFSVSRRVPGLAPGLQRTGKFCGGLFSDIRRKCPLYLSDYIDAMTSVQAITQCLAATVFLFFANLTNIITFGGVIETMLDKQIGTIENLLSGALSGILFAMFSGQPLNILSATGPMLVFEAVLYKFCLTVCSREQSWNFMAARFWVGTWSTVMMLIIVATDASFVVALITKFTEESFASLISIVFIIEAFQQLTKIAVYAPLTRDPTALLNDPCVCGLQEFQNFTGTMYYSNYTNSTAEDNQIACKFQPDVYLFSILLFIGAFFVSFGLKQFRNTGYFSGTVRRILSDFSVLIAIVLMTSISVLVGVKTPSLNVPTTIEPTSPRNWIINPFEDISWIVILAAIVPAIFFTILVFMDQQITCVIVNRKENKLKKGYGYHLDLLVLAICIQLCALLGLPYYVAATVISIMHVDALKIMAENTAPGEKPQFLGVREQRITAVLSNLLIGCAVFITPVIRLVPLPVLLGLFLYMGVVSLAGQQLTQRLLLLFMPPKYQPDLLYLRMVPLKRVHIFTALQVLGLVLLYAVKSVKQISMLFPVMLVVICAIRKLMERIFTAQELSALDHALPAWKQIAKPSRNRKQSEAYEFRRLSTLRR